MLLVLPTVLFVYLNVHFQTLNDFVKMKRVSRKAHLFLSSKLCESMIDKEGGFLLTVSDNWYESLNIISNQVKRLDFWSHNKIIEFPFSLKEAIFHSWDCAKVFLKNPDSWKWRIEKISFIWKEDDATPIYFSPQRFEVMLSKVKSGFHSVTTLKLEIPMKYSIFLLNCLSTPASFYSVSCIQLKLSGSFLKDPKYLLHNFIQKMYPNIKETSIDTQLIQIDQTVESQEEFRNFENIALKPRDFLWTHNGKYII